MFFNQKIQPIIARSFMVLFTLILINGVVFRHSHKLSNGKIITHAHPYKPVSNSPFQPNNHTINELYVLDLVSNGLFNSEIIVASITFLSLAIFQQKLSFLYYRQRFQTRFVASISLRGPPVF